MTVVAAEAGAVASVEAAIGAAAAVTAVASNRLHANDPAGRFLQIFLYPDWRGDVAYLTGFFPSRKTPKVIY